MTSWPADFLVGDWRVSPKLNRISKNGQTVGVKHKSMEVLVCLADANGEVVSRNDIMDEVWPGMAVTDDVLTQSVVELRKAFNDDAMHSKVIETIPRVGFRLLARVAPLSTESEPSNVPKKRRNYWFFGMALLVVSAALWIVLERQESDRQPVIKVEEAASIAVLPFVNMSEDPDNEYFADGISEEIRSLLTRIPDLKVIGRTSSLKFKGTNEDLRVIGQMLGVMTVLEGSVRKSGDRVRISAMLIDVSDGTHLWSETYNRTVGDIFSVQDDVAAAVIGALEIHVGTAPSRGRPTENPEAFAMFLKAKVAANDFNWQGAEALLLRAVELDPNFAEAYEMLSHVYWFIPGGTNVIESQMLLGDTAGKAIALEPGLVLARTYAEVAKSGPGIRLRTIEAFERAARERPGNPAIQEGFVFLLTEFGYLREAVTVAKRLHELDPLSGSANIHLPLTLHAAGHTADAVAALEFANQSEFEPHFYRWGIEGLNLVETQDETAIAHIESWLEQHDYPDPTWFRELVTAARDPATGQAYLDRRIPEIVASITKVDDLDWEWRTGLTSLYLLFGYLDRFYELVLATEPIDTTWHGAGAHLWQGAIFHRLGATAHPQYLELAERMGVFEVWEARGPPDFCDNVDGQWICE